MPAAIAPEFERFIAAERRAKRLPPAAPVAREGEVSHTLLVDASQASDFLRVAARRACGLFRPSQRSEVVWVDGDSELAVGLTVLRVELADGLLRVLIPVRCDQTGDALVDVTFAVGSPADPAGLYAATHRRPGGPAPIVSAWSEALVAFAWQCVLGMVAGLAGAMGKDGRGNVLVPVEIAASTRGLLIVPMARHRFAGSSGLRATRPEGGR